MTDPGGAENAQVKPQAASDDATTGINQEHAEELASADYQARLKEFDNVDTTPVVSAPAPGEPGAVEMPKP